MPSPPSTPHEKNRYATLLAKQDRKKPMLPRMLPRMHTVLNP
jgi:hypothetical protein